MSSEGAQVFPPEDRTPQNQTGRDKGRSAFSHHGQSVYSSKEVHYGPLDYSGDQREPKLERVTAGRITCQGTRSEIPDGLLGPLQRRFYPGSHGRCRLVVSVHLPVGVPKGPSTSARVLSAAANPPSSASGSLRKQRD